MSETRGDVEPRCADRDPRRARREPSRRGTDAAPILVATTARRGLRNGSTPPCRHSADRRSHASPAPRRATSRRSPIALGRRRASRAPRRAALLPCARRSSEEAAAYASSGLAEAHLLEAERALARGDALPIAAQADIEKDLKRTFRCGRLRHAAGATRTCSIAHAQRNPAAGVLPESQLRGAELLMVPLSEEDVDGTVVEDLMPPDYYTRENDILGARVDQLVYSTLLGRACRGWRAACSTSAARSRASRSSGSCALRQGPAARVNPTRLGRFVVYGDHALFAVGLVMMQMGEARVVAPHVLRRSRRAQSDGHRAAAAGRARRRTTGVKPRRSRR